MNWRRLTSAIGDGASGIEAAPAVGCSPILVLTGLGREQLPLLRARGYNRYQVAADLEEAVQWILATEGAKERRGCAH